MVNSICGRGFQPGTMVTNLPASAGGERDTGLIPGSGRSPGVGNGYPLQYSCLGNYMDRRAWWTVIQGLARVDMSEHTACIYGKWFIFKNQIKPPSFFLALLLSKVW